MLKEIEINGQRIVPAELTFGTVRQMIGMGVDFNDLGKDLYTLVSAYVRISTGLRERAADELIQRHIVKGGNLDDVLDAFKSALDESDFFQALAKTKETEAE